MDSKGATDVLSRLNELPETILEDTNCLGTTDDVLASIEKYKEAGMTHMSIMNRGPDTNQVYEIFRDKIIPYFNEMEK